MVKYLQAIIIPDMYIKSGGGDVTKISYHGCQVVRYVMQVTIYQFSSRVPAKYNNVY